jgi:GABA permease
VRALVLTSEPVDAQMLRAALGDDARDAEVLVVSPALQDSPIRFWMSDVDDAIERARQVEEETVERLDEAGGDAAGDTGESDPLQALADALTTFDADQILVFTHPDDEGAYLEEDVAAEAERRFGIPVVHSVVER